MKRQMLSRLWNLRLWNSMRAHALESPLPKQLHVRGMGDLIPLLTAVNAAATFVYNVVTISWGERFNPKHLCIVAMVVSTLTPFPLAWAIDSKKSEVLPWLQAAIAFGGVIMLVGYGSILRRLLPEESQKHQRLALVISIAWTTGSLLGNLAFLLIDPENPSLLWGWAVAVVVLHLITLVSLIRVPYVHEGITKTEPITMRERVLLVGRATSTVAAPMFFVLTSQYGSSFIESSKLAFLPIVLLIILLPIGEWMAIQAQKRLANWRWRKLLHQCEDQEMAWCLLVHYVTAGQLSTQATKCIEKTAVVGSLVIMAMGLAITASNPHELPIFLIGLVITGLGHGGVSAPMGKLVTRTTTHQTAQSSAFMLSSSFGWGLAALAGWITSNVWWCGILVALICVVAVSITQFPEHEASER